MEHISVFYDKVLEALDVQPDGIYVDATLGAGGHSTGILDQLKTGKLIAFDLDTDPIEHFESLHSKSSDRFVLRNQNFGELENVLTELNLTRKLNGVLADLGWSTDQLDSMPGLSFMQDAAELDMRFDKTLMVSARDLLNNANYEQLAELFSEFGGFVGKELNSLVKAIIDTRKSNSFDTVGDFTQLLDGVKSHRSHNIKTRAFQALRIAVNNEYANLQTFLSAVFTNLVPGGRLIIITFHSGEEEIVADYFGELIQQDQAANIFTEKFVRPTVQELRRNIHSHSAKLWGVTKL